MKDWRDSASSIVDSASHMKLVLNSPSWINNSASTLKIVVDSTSRLGFLPSIWMLVNLSSCKGENSTSGQGASTTSLRNSTSYARNSVSGWIHSTSSGQHGLLTRAVDSDFDFDQGLTSWLLGVSGNLWTLWCVGYRWRCSWRWFGSWAFYFQSAIAR